VPTARLTQQEIWNKESRQTGQGEGWHDSISLERQTRCTHANMHAPTAEGNFCDEHGNAIKPATVGDNHRHMGYADKSDRMSNSYSISFWT
jgi:hypothetical protein